MLVSIASESPVNTKDDMDSDTATESNLSLKSRSFLNRVNDRLRKILDQFFKICNARHRQTFYILGECLCLQHWKHLHSWERITQKTLHSIKNIGKDLTMKQMFDISEKLMVGQSDEIYGVSPSYWEDPLWKQLFVVSETM